MLCIQYTSYYMNIVIIFNNIIFIKNNIPISHSVGLSAIKRSLIQFEHILTLVIFRAGPEFLKALEFREVLLEFWEISRGAFW